MPRLTLALSDLLETFGQQVDLRDVWALEDSDFPFNRSYEKSLVVGGESINIDLHGLSTNTQHEALICQTHRLTAPSPQQVRSSPGPTSIVTTRTSTTRASRGPQAMPPSLHQPPTFSRYHQFTVTLRTAALTLLLLLHQAQAIYGVQNGERLANELSVVFLGDTVFHESFPQIDCSEHVYNLFHSAPVASGPSPSTLPRVASPG